jgi:speckle-type POZ protein
MPRGKLVAVGHVGGEEVVVREQVLSETQTIRFVFHDFENLPHDRDEETISSVLLCHGYQWNFQLYPGGYYHSKEAVYLSVYLHCVSAEQEDCKVKAKYAFRIPSANHSSYMGEDTFCRKSKVMGLPNFRRRSDVLDPSKDFLVDGNLTIEVDIQVYKDASPFWEPKSELKGDFMKILESANQSGDVTFQVGSEEFPAHRLVLEARAPVLAALIEDYPPETPIHIQDIKTSVFRSLLRFIYANDVPKPEEFQKEARELLDVANRFGCKGLKLSAEAELVESGITVDTAADLVLLGDAKNCALLKEAAMDFFAANPTSVMSSPGWEKVEESLPLMKELMAVLASNKKRPAPADADEERDHKRMCVSALRRRLDEKGLDVDGSREMLVSRLEKVEVSLRKQRNASD